MRDDEDYRDKMLDKCHEKDGIDLAEKTAVIKDLKEV